MIDIETLLERAKPISDDGLPSADSPEAQRLFFEIISGARSPSRRRVRRVRRVAVVGITAIVATALALAFLIGSGRPVSNLGGSTKLTVAEFFHRAANAALDQVTTVPQADQYIYTETESGTGGRIRTWLSTNGTRPGVEIITEPGTKLEPTTAASEIQACTVTQAAADTCALANAGYYADLPTQPNQVLSYLATIHAVPANAPAGAVEPAWQDNDLAKAVGSLFTRSYVTPAQRSAIYDLMAQTPGFSVVQGMTDVLGRSGVGIEWQYEGGTGALIFDPTTYAFLGWRTWPPGQSPNSFYPRSGIALVTVTIVNQAGQTP